MVRFIFSCWNYLLQIVLQFDGSLRPPRDPGFPTLPRSLATCAASIYWEFPRDEDGNNNGEHPVSNTPTTTKLLAVGAKLLQVDPSVTTSAHAEYEGLLLGLAWLLENQHLWRLPQRGSNDDGTLPPVSLVIRGDCKSVLDQLHHHRHHHDNNNMTGSTSQRDAIPRSHARVMQSQYKRAVAFLEQLLEADDAIPTVSSKRLVVQHVPRASNTLCDHLCAQVIEYVEEHAHHQLLDDVDCLLASANYSCSSSTSTSLLLSMLREHHLIGPTAEYCPIRYSIRPPLYHYLAHIARDLEDSQVLQAIGQALEHEAKSLWSLSMASKEQTPDNHLTLLDEAYQYQREALLMLMTGNNIPNNNKKQKERQLQGLTRKQEQLRQRIRRKYSNWVAFGNDEYPLHSINQLDGSMIEQEARSRPKWFPPATRATNATDVLYEETTIVTRWRMLLRSASDQGVDSDSINSSTQRRPTGPWLLSE